MEFFKRLIDVVTLGSDRPIRRLIAYYIVLGAALFLLFHFLPSTGRFVEGDRVKTLVQDGLSGKEKEKDKDKAADVPAETGALAPETIVVMLSTLALMLPVSWVFMSSRRARDFSQSVAQTLIILPIVVAGIVLVVRTSLALAFSLGGIVAGLRFRTTMRDTRDQVYIFLGIGVGLAVGVQSFIVAAVLSVTFNFVVLLIWRFDFGGNVLEPTVASQWAEPLGDLAERKTDDSVPDRDLVLAVSAKEAAVLAKRFSRVHRMLGPAKHKPRFNAILTVRTDSAGEAQPRIETVLSTLARRWRLDQVIANEGKPGELYYLVGMRKSVTHDELITAIRQTAGDKIQSAELEIGDAAARERTPQDDVNATRFILAAPSRWRRRRSSSSASSLQRRASLDRHRRRWLPSGRGV